MNAVAVVRFANGTLSTSKFAVFIEMSGAKCWCLFDKQTWTQDATAACLQVAHSKCLNNKRTLLANLVEATEFSVFV